jgi:hypothetical protein
MRQRLSAEQREVFPDLTSSVRALQVDWFTLQPGAGGAGGEFPAGHLPVVDGNFRDDASQAVQRSATFNLAYRPVGLEVGMWVRPTLGIRFVDVQMFHLANMMITSISENLNRQGGATIEVEDPASVLNGRPHTVDTTVTGTLRDMVNEACTTSLARVTDVTGVPATPVPLSTVVEFGTGRWDACITAADMLGVALRFNDIGDVIGWGRGNLAPAASADVSQAMVPPGGRRLSERYPSTTVVMLNRGSATPLYGTASVAGPLPNHYRPFVLTDRQDGDEFSPQSQADQLALDLLNIRQRQAWTRFGLPRGCTGSARSRCNCPQWRHG